MEEKHSIGIIGLGQMGLGMAQNLQDQGESVVGFDIDPVRQVEASNAGISIADSLEVLISLVDVLILSLPKDSVVEQVCLGDEGIYTHAGSLGKPRIIIDTSTSTADTSRKLADMFATLGISFIDTPVSGGPTGARSGSMSMVVGASQVTYEQILPLLQKMSAKQVRVGDVGAGNIVKIGNNLLVAAQLILTAEMVSLAHQMGVWPADFLRGLNQGSGRSAVSEVNFEKWILNHAFDSGFSMGLMRKDVGLAKQLLDEHGQYPMAQLAAQLWADSGELADDADFNTIVTLTNESLFDPST